MRIPLCILALSVSAFGAATAELPDTPDQAPPNAPADTAKPANPATPPARYNGWVFNGLADGYWSYNESRPTAGINQLRNFNIHSIDPRFSLGKVTIDKSDKVVGIHLDVGAGETMRLIHAGDVAAQENKGLRYFEQMYLILKPTNARGAEIDFGQFVTSAGAEVIESNGNFNYTRSLLFALAIPYYHFGFKSTVPVTKEVTVGFQLVNAWNTVWGNNTLDNVGVTLAIAKPKYGYFLNYYGGPQKLGTRKGKRNLIDTTLTFAPTSKVNAYINADYGRDNRIGSGYDHWYGLAGAAKFQVSQMFAVAARAEFFNDPTGFTTGQRQVLKEGTLTGELKLSDHLTTRLEYRHDSSDHAFFDRGPRSPSKDMNTVTLGIVAIVGPLK